MATVNHGEEFLGSRSLRFLGAGPSRTTERDLDDKVSDGGVSFLGATPPTTENVSHGELMEVLPKLMVPSYLEDPNATRTPGVLVKTPADVRTSKFAIQHVLNPAFFEDPRFFWDVASRLRDGQIVVLRDAFVKSFADRIHAAIDSFNTTDWVVETDANLRANAFRKRKPATDATVLNNPDLRRFYDIFTDDKTEEFIEALSGRDCQGHVEVAPALFKPGDFGAPHNDWIGQRAVTFTWNLTKQWRPEWGGTLHWSGGPKSYQNGSYPATYNTMYLFNVRANSTHSVTPVSPQSKHHKRLSMQGWWNSAWLPASVDDVVKILGTPSSRKQITLAQSDAMVPILSNATGNLTPNQLHRISDGVKHTEFG